MGGSKCLAVLNLSTAEKKGSKRVGSYEHSVVI
jgi:hypothetical protein